MAVSLPATADYSQHPSAIALMDKMEVEHQYDREQLLVIFRAANKEPKNLKSMANSAEKVKPWYEYRKHFITDARVKGAVKFISTYGDALDRAEAEYGVPPQMITAIIGVETNFGSYTGKASVLDALSTLAFDHPTRGKFFTSELEEYLLLVRDRDWQAAELKGSYAGAMGLAQFMPSNYRRLAVDFDGDGVVDLHNPVDAIGSVANYFSHHGWKGGEAVANLAVTVDGFDTSQLTQGIKTTSSIGELAQAGYLSRVAYSPSTPAMVMEFEGEKAAEYWIGLNNFYVVARYNPRQKYAMAVYQLSEEIREAL
ncbi:MAG: lytic murein transglycosylase B [Pseudomonadales bacterium]